MFCVHQPVLFPALYLMKRWCRAGKLVWLGDDLPKSDGLHNRFIIGEAPGEVLVTFPVCRMGTIDTTQLTEFPHRARKMVKTLQQMYSKAPHLDALMSDVVEPWIRYTGYYLHPSLGYASRYSVELLLKYLDTWLSLWDSTTLCVSATLRPEKKFAVFSKGLGDVTYFGSGDALNSNGGYFNQALFDGVYAIQKDEPPTLMGRKGMKPASMKVSILDALMWNSPSAMRAYLEE